MTNDKAFLLAYLIYENYGARLDRLGIFSSDVGSITTDFGRGLYACLLSTPGANFAEARDSVAKLYLEDPLYARLRATDAGRKLEQELTVRHG